MNFNEWFEQRYPAGADSGVGWVDPFKELIRESCRDIARAAWEAAELEGYKEGLMNGSETVRRLVLGAVRASPWHRESD